MILLDTGQHVPDRRVIAGAKRRNPAVRPNGGAKPERSSSQPNPRTPGTIAPASFPPLLV
jgi:hypothetical protein